MVSIKKQHARRAAMKRAPRALAAKAMKKQAAVKKKVGCRLLCVRRLAADCSCQGSSLPTSRRGGLPPSAAELVVMIISTKVQFPPWQADRIQQDNTTTIKIPPRLALNYPHMIKIPNPSRWIHDGSRFEQHAQRLRQMKSNPS